MLPDHIVTPLEVKLAPAGKPGEFSGYGAVFNNLDSHGDIIVPGAFQATLAERKREGRRIPMHVMHGIYGGDGLPVGVWDEVEEDGKGLKVRGRISGLNTETGRVLYERVKDGAFGGLSIGYRVAPDGATYGQKASDPKRTLTKLHLGEISLVDDPSNPLARVEAVKLSDRGELVDLLRRGGLSKAAAKQVAAGGWPALAGEVPAGEDTKAILRELSTSIDGTLSAFRRLNARG